MKVVVPMAGRGSRFVSDRPKPLIVVGKQPMFVHALASLDGVECAEVIFVALRFHERKFHLSKLLERYVHFRWRLVLIDDVTEGQLCTVLAAREHFEPSEDLLVISSDTFVVSDIGQDIRERSADCHGLISTCNLPGERWSFARVNEAGRVVEVAEKTRISDHASTGMYYFSCAREFMDLADDIIARNERTRGEFYIIPVYQKLIDSGRVVGISQATAMWDMGTAEAASVFERFLQNKGNIE